MAKRKLKGKNVENIKPEQKEKMKKTLQRMDKVREEDNQVLRSKINQNIKEYKERLKRADINITNIRANLKQAEDVKLRIEGAIFSLEEILNNDSESKS